MVVTKENNHLPTGRPGGVGLAEPRRTDTNGRAREPVEKPATGKNAAIPQQRHATEFRRYGQIPDGGMHTYCLRTPAWPAGSVEESGHRSARSSEGLGVRHVTRFASEA